MLSAHCLWMWMSLVGVDICWVASWRLKGKGPLKLMWKGLGGKSLIRNQVLFGILLHLK